MEESVAEESGTEENEIEESEMVPIFFSSKKPSFHNFYIHIPERYLE